MAPVRPKKIGACSNSNGSKPRNGEPAVQVARAGISPVGTLRKLGTSTLHDLAQLDFDQFLELSEGLVVGERPDKNILARVARPLINELLEGAPLSDAFVMNFRGIGRKRWNRSIDPDMKLRQPCSSFLPLQGMGDFVFGAGLGGRAIGELAGGVQSRPKSRPQKTEDHVEIGRIRNLSLERF